MSATITDVDVLVTSPGRNYVLVKITTSDGVVGWGDATLNGRELAVASYVRDHLAATLIGRPADRIEDAWQLLYRGAYWRRGPVTMAAIGAVDLALWDIKGKVLNAPVYQLLGGAVRDRLLTYTHAHGWGPEELIDAVEARRAEGFLAVRAQFGVPGLDTVYGVSALGGVYEPAIRGSGPPVETWDTPAYLRHAPEVLSRLREHVGPELHLLHDTHHRLNPREALRLARSLEPVDLFWLEDVIGAENQELLRGLRDSTSTPLAIGEVFTTIWDCHRILSERLVDYVRAAVSHAGGISHLRKILTVAELYQVAGGPHGPSDISPVAMAASVHLGFATHNIAIQEHMGYPDVVAEVIRADYRLDGGYLHAGSLPGLGVEIDEDAAARFPYTPGSLPIARLRDGSMTNW